mmetsp:Transcript_76621/g.212915  ORF Transcript_76621/g.212915 Transcript_76621/m.212915 type:complete len:205 (-) Transcript_76621:1098-1712(-)
MNKQDINAGRHGLPLLRERKPTRKIECPIAELGLPWAAIDANATHVGLLVLQVHHPTIRAAYFGERGTHRARFWRIAAFPVFMPAISLVEGQVVVASDDDLPREGQRSEPTAEIHDLFQLARHREVPRVEKHVTRGQPLRQLSVTPVRVGDANETQSVGGPRGRCALTAIRHEHARRLEELLRLLNAAPGLANLVASSHRVAGL